MNKNFKPIALLSAMLFAVGAGWAGAEHNHGESTPAVTGNAPKRLPDGSVFLPKTSQRQLAVRTVITEERMAPQSIELTGRVLMDSNSGGRVQPTQAGRVEAGARGLPRLGQRVQKGETLAIVRSSASAIERGNQQSQSAELRAQLDLARRRVERLAQLEGTVPQKDIEAARSDVTSLQQRVAAVSASVSAVETLSAPVGGVISAINVVAGQVVDAREVLFEIVDPAKLIVEAQAFDVALLTNIGAASASPAPGVSVPLTFMGAGRAQREGAIPLQFRTTGSAEIPMAVNQAVKVLVHTKSTVKGIAVPAASIVKSASNQDMVWVHAGAETFQARPVRVTPLDGASVSVVDGLKAGERVVTQGAALVNQVR
ncbi:MAG: HlyD family efflux transporter periplasmic adaptor subunit [Pseudomonadota bacterium]